MVLTFKIIPKQHMGGEAENFASGRGVIQAYEMDSVN